MSKPRVCGIDFDNTLIFYDRVLARIVTEQRLLKCGPAETKKDIRDRLRKLPDGEIEWQRCQGLMYASRIGEAELIEGVSRFFELSKREQMSVYIISHKTRFSPFDETRSNLREVALNWMTANGFFEPDGLGLTYEDVFFSDTRQGKINKIKDLQCTYFIDDLEETLVEESFPEKTIRMLYEPGRQTAAPAGVKLMRSWHEINQYIFGTR